MIMDTTIDTIMEGRHEWRIAGNGGCHGETPHRVCGSGTGWLGWAMGHCTVRDGAWAPRERWYGLTAGCGIVGVQM
jgi:hypothetical protein